MTSKFLATQNKGFQLTFENGWTISVQWGPGNYCSNGGNVPNPWDWKSRPDNYEATTAEIAIWDSNGDWLDFSTHSMGTNQVKGFCDVAEVVEWIDKVSKFSEDTIRKV